MYNEVKLSVHFFDMCLPLVNDCETAKKVFAATENKFYESSLPWDNCVGQSVDNTHTMIADIIQ